MQFIETRLKGAAEPVWGIAYPERRHGPNDAIPFGLVR
jgi:hypothetical protein